MICLLMTWGNKLGLSLIQRGSMLPSAEPRHCWLWWGIPTSWHRQLTTRRVAPYLVRSLDRPLPLQDSPLVGEAWSSLPGSMGATLDALCPQCNHLLAMKALTVNIDELVVIMYLSLLVFIISYWSLWLWMIALMCVSVYVCVFVCYLGSEFVYISIYLLCLCRDFSLKAE